jgi:hypothetical protein
MAWVGITKSRDANHSSSCTSYSSSAEVLSGASETLYIDLPKAAANGLSKASDENFLVHALS